MPFFVIRVLRDQEEATAHWLADVAERTNIPITSMIFSDRTPGYIYIETQYYEYVRQLVSETYKDGCRWIRGILPGMVTVEEVERLVRPPEVTYNVNDRVEVVTGLMRGMRGTVIAVEGNNIIVQFDEAKSLLPVKMHKSQVRKIKEVNE